MKRLLLIAIALAGCAEHCPPRIVIEGHAARVDVREEGSTHIVAQRGWYDAEQLDQIVREYAREKNIDFDFRGTGAQISIPRQREWLARVEYASGFGKPVLSAKIGWDGHVIEHHLSIAVCAPMGRPDAVVEPR